MKKVIFFSFFLILILQATASGFEDTVERYPSGECTDYWTTSSSRTDTRPHHPDSYHSMSIHQAPDPRGISNTVLKLTETLYDWGYHTATGKARTTDADISPNYIAFNLISYTPGSGFYVTIYKSGTTEALIEFSSTDPTIDAKYELIKSGSYYNVYQNGALVSSITSTAPDYTGNVDIEFSLSVLMSVPYQTPVKVSSVAYIDDITDGSCIGIPKIINEAMDNFTYTWSSQLMRSYTSPQTISLYSLSNPANAGLIKTWNIPHDDDPASSEFGHFSLSRADTLGSSFGLYLLEMTRGEDILTDQYFYYDQLSSPNGYPELLFLGESSVKTEIRDDNNNGGEIQGGGSVYLYPEIREDATYNFTYNILEAPYKIKTELTTVYNNTAINSTTIHYTGLSNQNYKISVDGADAGSTNGADTFSHTFTDWGTEKNHIISFAPDYTIAGVCGEVKNSETQQGIKSATVSISGANFSKTLYTDDNGLFYLTKGMEPGKTYTITVSKTGYTTPPSQTAITVDGSTTRQDFYMDKIPGVDGEGIYYSPHNVRFVVTDRYLFERYDANVTISGENVTTETQRTGTDGVCVFKMTENTRYEIVTEYNGMKQTDYISPIEYSYYIILDATKTSLLPTSQFYEMCNITITKNELNSSHAEIAASYSDTGSDTQSVYFTLGKTDGNNTMNALETSPTGNGNMTYTFVVQDYIGEDYVVKVNVDHNKFGNVEKQYGVNFPGSKLPFTGNAIIALCVLIFFVVAMQWGKADAHMGAVLICGLGWWFYYLDIFRKLGDGTNAVIGTGLGLATVYAILSMINRKRDEGGI